MSRECTHWAWELPIKSQCDLLVMLALANYANHENKCWASHSRLAAYARCSVSSVQRSIKVLIAAGYVKVRKNTTPKGKKTTNIYTLAMPSNRSVKMTDTLGQNDRYPSVKMTDEPYTMNLKDIKPAPLTPQTPEPAEPPEVGQAVKNDLKGRKPEHPIRADLVDRVARLGLNVTSIEREARTLWPKRLAKGFTTLAAVEIGKLLPGLSPGEVSAALAGNARAYAHVHRAMIESRAVR